MVTKLEVEERLKSALNAVDVKVVDISGGCGQSFEVYVTSPDFDGKRLIQRHQMVNQAMSEFMQDIHALSIKRTKTPTEMATQN